MFVTLSAELFVCGCERVLCVPYLNSV